MVCSLVRGLDRVISGLVCRVHIYERDMWKGRDMVGEPAYTRVSNDPRSRLVAISVDLMNGLQ